ncbi:MAG: H-type lectin domain-containing protein [Bacteroidota bacterium]
MTLTLLALLLVAMPGFAQDMHQKGDFQANVNSEGWTLNSGSGQRSHIVYVKFADTFKEKPAVMLSLTAYDGAAGKDGNIRISVKAENISRDGFVIRVATWGDSRVTGVDGSWVAFGK